MFLEMSRLSKDQKRRKKLAERERRRQWSSNRVADDGWEHLREFPVDIEKAKLLNQFHPFTVIKTSLWRNREWSCVLWEGEHHLHIGIEHVSKTPRHDWLAFQRIKNELVGPDQEMVELYPAERRMVNCINMYHLWGAKGVKIMLGWLPDFQGHVENCGTGIKIILPDVQGHVEKV